MSDVDTGSALPPAKALDRKAQIRLLSLIGGALVALYALMRIVGWLMQPAPVKEEVTPPGSFRPTSQQMQQLQFRTVGTGDDPDAVQATGIISVNQDASTPIFLPVSGQIGNVFVEAGQRVVRGQPLFEVSSTDYVDVRNAMLTAAAQRATASAQLQTAQQNAARQKEIFATAGGAEKDYRQAQADLVAAQSAMRAANAGLTAARDKLVLLGKSPSSGASMRAVFRAPVSGTVASRAIAPGQYVTAGGTDALLTIADLSRVWLVAQLSEQDASSVHVGDIVTVTTPAYPGRVFQATIQNVAAELDPVTHRLPVRATVANPDGALKPQMFASFSIRRRTPRAALLVPSQAVIHEGDSARVWVVGRNGLLWSRDVRVGDSANGYDSIVSGLRPGERIVSGGAIFVNEAGLGA